MKNCWHRHELMYCGNVHPCTTIEELIVQVEQHLVPIKHARKLNRMYLGMWLNVSLLEQLSTQPKMRTQWFNLLSKHNFIIKSLNAFPQFEFHGREIKEQVYFPEWCQQERLNYTIQLADFITQYPGVFTPQVTISTVPLGYKASWNDAKQKSAIEHLNTIASYLASINQTQGIHIRLCLEMEPDCRLELTHEIIDFFRDDLKIASQIDNAAHLGICYDVCHQAVMFEDITKSIISIESHNITIGKIQVSNAMSFQVKNKKQVQSTLASYNNSPYLHQMQVKGESGTSSFPDLDFNLLNNFDVQNQVRIHFHVPVNSLQITAELGTTQHAIFEIINALSLIKNKPDLEIETYTWTLMTDQLSLNECIFREIDWLEKALDNVNLIVD
jgi:hypothetical protein